MQPFLDKVAEYINKNHPLNTDRLCVVLPGKRGALFLKHHLSRRFSSTIWLPAIVSAEEFVNNLSGLVILEDVDLLCRLYDSYKIILAEKSESFEQFAKWGHLMLQDFNEIDRYLVKGNQLYANLQSVKEIENWSLSGDEITDFQKNYLEFMKLMGLIYEHFTKSLLAQNLAYQGLAYRKAVETFLEHPFLKSFEHIIFCGFNALNNAETYIFSELCKSQKAVMLWDADHYYLDNLTHEAGLFLRKNFKVFDQKDKLFIGNDFKQEKNINIVSVENLYWLGIVLGVLAALTSSLFNVFNGILTNQIPSVVITFYEMIFGMLGLSLYCLFNGDFDAAFFSLSAHDIGGLAVLAGVCTAFPFITSVSLMKHLSPYTITLTVNLETVYGIILAIFLYHENKELSVSFYIGVSIILFAVFFNAWLKSKLSSK